MQQGQSDKWAMLSKNVVLARISQIVVLRQAKGLIPAVAKYQICRQICRAGEHFQFQGPC